MVKVNDIEFMKKRNTFKILDLFKYTKMTMIMKTVDTDYTTNIKGLGHNIRSN